MAFTVKRAYDPPDPGDGTRVLVDRLWPRGLTKDRARIDEWLKDLTPSNELRQWYHEDPAGRGKEFDRRYRAELKGEAQSAAVDRLKELAGEGPVTLVTSAKDVEHSHVPVLVRHVSP
ncbi:MAG: DUF488 family protein [Hamadaea sp.]|nr:DUF488 family protein [Hamadaea sp.]